MNKKTEKDLIIELLTFAKPSTEEKINLLRAHKYALIGQKKELLRKIRDIDKEIKEILKGEKNGLDNICI